MPDSFGARLRRRREERQIDLVSIAHQTKIKLPLLEALERDDVSQWPSGLFRRAYIRAYAQIIGLDPDVVVREFLEVHPDPGDLFLALEAGAADDPARKDAPPPTRLRNIVDSAIESLGKLRRGASSSPVFTEPAEERSRTEKVDETTPAAPGSLPSTPTRIDAAEHEREDAERELQRIRQASAAAIRAMQDSTDATLEALAHLCTELARVTDRHEVQRLLQDAAHAINATGLIVWLWDERAEGLRPALACGYSDRVLAHLPTVRRDADNATAAAYRSATVCEVRETAHTSAALVVPLLIPGECAGVLAIELTQGVQPQRSVRAIAAILAAALTQLVLRSQPDDQDAVNDQASAPH
jgi:hypothetical protein